MTKPGDLGFLRVPQPLKVDEELHEKVKKLTQPSDPVKQQVLHDTVGVGNTVSDVDGRLRSEGGKTFLDVSMTTSAPGAQATRWTPQNPTLHLASGTLKPIQTVLLYTP